jgi:alpha-L-fucosidase
VRLREYLPLGQRVESFALDTWNGGGWEEFYSGTAIGNQRLVRTRYLTTSKVRLRITGAPVCPAISELGLFAIPLQLSEPRITRDRAGMVSLACETAGPWIRYTLDGSEPTAASPLYEKPFALPLGGTVKARAFLPQGKQQSAVVSEAFGVAKAKWKVLSASYQAPGGEASRVIDDNPRTLWNTHGPDGERAAPQEVVIDLGETLTLTGFTLTPRSDGLLKGTPDRYEVYVSEDGKTWGAPAAAGEFGNIRANPVRQTVLFAKPAAGRYLRFVATHVLEAGHVAVAEIGVLAK